MSLTFSTAVAGAYFSVFALALLWNLGTRIAAALGARFFARHFAEPTWPAEPDVVVTLVHGTWARDAEWTLADSALRATIARAAGGSVAFQRFVWSGKNSIAARRRALEGLVAHLRRLIEGWPRARHYVVGHSHGGNVALQALGDAALSGKVDGLVCLSTPFLNATPRELGPVGETALRWLPVLILFYVGELAVKLIAPPHADVFEALMLPAALLAGFALWRGMRRFASAAATSLASQAIDPSKVLILRTTGDEAAAALGAAHLVSWAAGRIWLVTSHLLGDTVATVEGCRRVLSRHAAASIAIAAFLALGGILVFTRPPATTPISIQVAASIALTVVFLALGVWARGGLVASFLGRFFLATLALPLFLVAILLGVAIGPELVVAGLLFQVTGEATPPGRWQIWQVPAAGGGLMHSTSYQDPRALEILERWMSAAEHREPLPTPVLGPVPFAAKPVSH
jgi:hypothetical protein